MEVDEFGKTTIESLYYDTPSRLIVRRSMEKPEYKEKIRLRSYGRATEDSRVFLELKRKADETVYKRRYGSTIPEVNRFFEGKCSISGRGQIEKEITVFRDNYKDLAPACLIIYDRTAYFEPGGDIRMTIDENPRYRMDDLDLTKATDGISLLPEGWSILEIKVQQAMPLWLTKILNDGHIYKTSFSKYGEAYKRQLMTADGRQ